MWPGETKKVLWEKVDAGWRLIIFRVEPESGESEIEDIMESDNRTWLVRQLIERTVPFADEMERSSFRWSHP